MTTGIVRGLGLPVLLVMASLGSAAAQQGPDTSMTCRLFPLACPGPVPPMPQPLVGPPEEQAEAPPPPVPHPARHARHVRKHAAKAAAQ